MKFFKALEERNIDRINKAIAKTYEKLYKLTVLREKIKKHAGR
jgi:hypothetical protein